MPRDTIRHYLGPDLSRGLLNIYEPVAGLLDAIRRNPGTAAQTTAEVVGPQADIAGMVESANSAGQNFRQGNILQGLLDSAYVPANLATIVLPMSASGIRKGAKAISKKADDLPTDEASRMARAREMGFDTETPWYHGTTHDIQEFGGGAHNAEGHFGAGHYFTDSPVDASANYAGVGPDLTNRIEQRAERIANELYDATDKPQEVLDRFGRMQAKRELKGPNDGAVYPALLRGKTVDVSNYTRGQPTVLESSPMPSGADFYDEASKKLGSTASHDEIYDLAESLADDALADWVPTGQLADFADGIRESAQQYGFDANEVLESIQDELSEGVASADSLDRSLRNSPLMYAEDPETGALVMNDVIRKAFNRAGFDNIVMDAKSAFPKMPNIPEGTRHIITSKPENIRSRFAKFDPAKKDSANILAGVGGGLLAADVLEQYLQEKKGLLY